VIAYLLVPTTARRPWDFETYLYASGAASVGRNPYDVRALEEIAGRPVGMPFLYPPMALPLFLPFLGMNLFQASIVWLAIKILAFLALFHLWRRHLIPEVPPYILAPAAALAFNGAVIWDLKTGNVTILQDLLLWLGFAALVHGRRVLAAAGIVASALFKLTPAVFLVLLVLPATDRRPSWRILLASLGFLVASTLVVPLTGMPWAPWFRHAFDVAGPEGIANPSFVSLATQLYAYAQGMTLAPRVLSWLWLAYAALVLLVSVPCLVRARSERDPKLWVLTLTALSVLLHPRPMAYGYLLAIPAALVLLPRQEPRSQAILLAAICIEPFLGLLTQFRDPWSSNLAFLTLLALWFLYAYSCVGRGTMRRGRAT
jgi:hypothetical protein